MRKQRMSRRIRDRMTAALAMLGTAVLMTGFVVTGTAGTAQATGGGHEGGGQGQQTCADLGYTMINQASGSESLDFGTLIWGGSSVSYDVAADYDVDLCVKTGGKGKGGKITEFSVAGPAEGSKSVGHWIKHIGYRFTYTPPPQPVVPEITWTDPCGTENDTVDGVPNDGYTFVVDEETGTVTFTPVEGYYLEGPETLTAEWTDVPCPLEATPVEPTVVQSEECDVEGSYTIPETAGVQYLLDGEPIEAGTYPGPEAGVLTAEPIGNTVLTIEDWSFDLVVEPAEVCEVAPTEASDVCTNIAGVQTAVPAGYSLVQGLCVADEVRGVETEVPAPAPAVAPAAGVVPTGVDAGFVAPAAEDTGSPLGLSLIAGGLMMLVAAGALQTGRLRRGAHEI